MMTFLLCAILYCFLVMVDCNEMGPGRWHVQYVEKCEEAYHKFKFEVSQNKINRTHDGFNAKVILDEAFTEEYAIRVEVCKYVDGGCKPYQVIAENSFVNYVNRYAEKNVKFCLELAGVDPPEFPVKEGEYEVQEYIFDYAELPKDGPYGEFCATCYMLENSKEVGCIELHVEFLEVDDDDDE